MTPRLGMWIAAIVGASLCFLAGYLWALRRRAAATATSSEEKPVPALRQEAQLRGELSRLEDRLRQTEMEKIRLECSLKRERARLSAEVAELKAKHERLDALLSTTDNERYERAIGVHPLEYKPTQMDKLREEKAQLLRQVGELEREAERLEELSELKNERTELLVQINVLMGRLKDMDALREENESLRETASEVGELRERVQWLLAEVTELRSQALVHGGPPVVCAPAQLTIPSTAERMQTMLERMAKTQSVRAVALADEQGLPVATTGEHGDALAAIAAFVNDIAEKARGLLPLGAIVEVRIADEHDLTITTRPTKTEDANLLLSTLTLGPGPNRREVTHLASASGTQQ